jgi:transposase
MLALIDLETRISAVHPIRAIKQLTDEVLAGLSPCFDAMYAEGGRPSIPPERLLKAGLLMALYSVRSERAFCEQLEYHLLFRWFLDMDLVEPSFDASTFSKNRSRLLEHEVAQAFFTAVVEHANARSLLSDEHFSVDGTLIEASASLKRFGPRAVPVTHDDPDAGNPSIDFKGKPRTNDTHRSTTDPEARLYTKGNGQTAKLCFMGHALMENRNGLMTDLRVTEATGYAERETALAVLDEAVRQGRHPSTIGADKAYDTNDFVDAIRARTITPHIAPNNWTTEKRARISSIGAEITTSVGFTLSQRKRKRIEEIFGWMKTVGGLRRTRYRGVARTQMTAYLVGAAYNLLRMSRLLAAEGR